MKKEVLLVILAVGILTLGAGIASADSCTLKGYVTNETGGGLGGVTVQISVDNPQGNYDTKTDNETFIGFYQKSFTCNQGSSEFDVIAYNSSHYGEASTTAADQQVTFLEDIIMNETFPSDSSAPEYYNDHDNSKLSDGVNKIAAGNDVETFVLWKDQSNLGKISLYSNITGNPDYLYSTCNFGTTNVSWCNRTIDTSGKEGETICWKEYGEDIHGNINEAMTNTEHCFNVVAPFSEDSIELVSPENQKSDAETSVSLKVKVTNPSGEDMNVTFHDATENRTLTTKKNIANGSSASISWGGLKEKTTYRWYVTVSDGVKKAYSDLWSFTTKEVEEEDDKRGGQYTTYRPRDEDLGKGYKKKFFNGWKISFNVEDESHNSEIKDITDENVEFTLDNQQVSMGDEETKKFDLNEDGYYDLQVSSSNLKGDNGISSVDLEFKSIHEEIPAEEEPGKDEEQVEEKPTEPEKPTERNYWYLWVLGVIVLSVIVWLIAKYNKPSKKKSKKK